LNPGRFGSAQRPKRQNIFFNCFDFAQHPILLTLDINCNKKSFEIFQNPLIFFLTKVENKMKGYVYMLECANGQYYTGSTTDVGGRFLQHQMGEGANFTLEHLPVKLIYVEKFDRIEQAFLREKQLQGWSRQKKEALIAGNIKMLHKLAECQNNSHFKNKPS
jgi:putative endonuclease